MATSTDVPIYTTTLGAVSSVTIDLSAYQQYTNLKFIVSAQRGVSGSGGSGLNMRFNGDSGSNYSSTLLYEGSPYGARLTNSTDSGYVGAAGDGNLVLNTVYLMNYSDSNMYKVFMGRYGSPVDGQSRAAVGTWRNTAAITSITMTPANGFASGTTISIYGVGSGINGAGGDSTSKASGGEVFADSTYYYHLFKGSGTFTPTASLTADILVVGGGGGSIGAGGGAGAGGLLGFASQSLTAQPYTITVGAGGAKGYPGSGTPSNGSNSKFGSLTTATGGAYGGGFTGATYISAGSGGGSGGGAPFNPAGSATTGIAGQGNAGSTGYQGTGGGDPRSGGGGGGAGGAAPNGSANTGGNGGIGATYNSTVGGSAGPYAFIDDMGAATGTGQLYSGHYYYAGGGGGEGKNYRGAAGIGGGGQGGTSEPAQYPDAGMASTGGGAGAGPNALSSYGGANGGSGVVIVRYAK
jgi:hypothetical protein